MARRGAQLQVLLVRFLKLRTFLTGGVAVNFHEWSYTIQFVLESVQYSFCVEFYFDLH
jgi:hypothetical protein